MTQPTRAFTSVYNGISNILINDVQIVEAFDPSFPSPNDFKSFKAIWDTGASNSLITDNVIDECGLKPSGRVTMRTPQGSEETDTYFVNVGLPNMVGIPNIKVARGVLDDADVLIGMDIIGMGDFAVTNKDGKTVFSFRMPSLACIDFVQESRTQTPVQASQRAVGRNARCPCGSGKKYKRCHGSLPAYQENLAKV